MSLIRRDPELRLLTPMRATVMAFSALACGPVAAQYAGGLNFDSVRYSLERPEAVREPSGFFIANTALDDRRIRYGLRLGYRVDPVFSVVSHFAQFDRRESTLAETRRYGLDLVGAVPLADRLAVSASAGIARIHGDAALNGVSGLYYPGYLGSSVSRAVTAAKMGLGVQYQFSQSLGLRFDVERYRALGNAPLGAFDRDSVALGLSLRF